MASERREQMQSGDALREAYRNIMLIGYWETFPRRAEGGPPEVPDFAIDRAMREHPLRLTPTDSAVPTKEDER